MAGPDVIVIGASAGGVEALMSLVGQLPPDLPAAVFVVLHIPPDSESALPRLLSRSGRLPATHAADRAPFRHGQIYVAPPDHHMLITAGHVHLVRGPKENRMRPAIDPTFRTAARYHGTRVVGVVLTGLLDDGTAGLLAIKRRRGVAVVQDPAEAVFPDMPRSALTYVDVDHVLRLRDIGPALVDLAHTEAEADGGAAIGEDIDFSAETVDLDPQALEQAKAAGSTQPFSCPDCGGVLFAYHVDDFLRYRCQVGHTFSPQSLLSGHSDMVDRALWDGFNMLDEHAVLLHELAADAERRGDTGRARRLQGEIATLQARKEQMRQLLLPADRPPPTTPAAGAREEDAV